MDPDRMRKIDRYAGIPINFCATILRKLRLFFVKPPTSTPKKILFVELSEMGSTILADPAMRKARDHFDAELYFVIFAKNRPSLRLLNTVPEENIFVLNPDNLLVLAQDVLAFRQWARKHGIDTVVDLELFSRFSALLCWLSGAGKVVGFFAFFDEGLYRGDFLTHKVAYNPHIHIAKNFIALVNALMASRPETPYSKAVVPDQEISLPIVEPTEDERDAMRARIVRQYPAYEPGRNRLVLVNPNSSMLLPQRRWHPANYVQLMEWVHDRFPDVVLVLTGAPGEEQGGREIVQALQRERCVDLTGALKIEELPTLYTISALMVTNDSGPGHFSAITRMPTIILFGPETPKLYGSLGNAIFVYAGLACSPCVSATNHRKTACADNVCLQEISPAMVFEQVKKVLDS